MGKRIVCIGICYLLLFGLVGISSASGTTTLGAIVALVCAVFGWQALNRFTPDMFIWMPIIGWINYIIIKFIISYFIGLFVAPYLIGSRIADSIEG